MRFASPGWAVAVIIQPVSALFKVSMPTNPGRVSGAAGTVTATGAEASTVTAGDAAASGVATKTAGAGAGACANTGRTVRPDSTHRTQETETGIF